ncbi:hypothetical protein RQP46_011166 [Phenoliferia psychrophenolica]
MIKVSCVESSDKHRGDALTQILFELNKVRCPVIVIVIQLHTAQGLLIICQQLTAGVVTVVFAFLQGHFALFKIFFEISDSNTIIKAVVVVVVVIPRRHQGPLAPVL